MDMIKICCYLVFTILACIFFTQYIFYDELILMWNRPTGRAFEGKFVVVTGASDGLGRASAIQFCKRGANLIITARSEEKLVQVKKECSLLGNNNVHVITGDMNKTIDIGSIALFIKKMFGGGIDHLLLNHVAPYRFGYFDGDMEYVRLLYQVNYLSYIDLTTKLLSSIKKRSGQIIVISALAGRIPMHVLPVYSGSKYALEGFYSSLRTEIENYGVDIKISVVLFGGVATESAKKSFSEMNQKVPDPSEGMISENKAAISVLSTALAKPDNLFQPAIFRIVDLMIPFFGDIFFDKVLFAFMGSDNIWHHSWNSDILGA